MLSEKHLFLTMKTFIFLFILQVFYQDSISAEVCVHNQYQNVYGVNDQSLSVIFRVAQPLVKTQNIRWTKDGSTLIGIYYSSSHVFISSDSDERYTLVEGVDDNTFVISIKFAQENDSGTHTINIYDGLRSVCTAFDLNLRIYNTDPTCNALLYYTAGKVELSCRWMQVDKGDYAEIVAGESVISKEETGMNHLGYVYREITNTFSVYVSMKNILAGNELPVKCLVFYGRFDVNKTCDFPSMMQHTIRNDQTEQFILKRCVPSEHISPTWWYSVGEKLNPIEFTKNYTLSNIRHIVFFYGGEDDHSNVIVHSMDKLHLFDYQFSNISFIVESSNNTQRQAHLTENLQCKILTITVNVTALTMISTSNFTRPSAPLTDMATTERTSPVTYIAEDNTKMWIFITAGVALALGMVIGICFTTLFGKVRKRDNTLSRQRGLTAAEGAESMEMVTQSPRPDECSPPHLTVSNQPLEEMSVNDPQFKAYLP